jgi:lipoate-protein ligase A
MHSPLATRHSPLPGEPLLGNSLDLTLPTVEENLAYDEALLIEADEGRAGAVLRFWEIPTFAVVLGASRRMARDVVVEHCRADGVPIARRSSGGGTVVIGPGTLNATVVLPGSMAPGLGAVDTAQAYVLGRMARALRSIEPAVDVSGSGDLTIAGRKFSGSAQRRLRTWFLVHLSILCGFPLDRVDRYLRQPDRQPDYRRDRPHGEFLRNLMHGRTIVAAAIRSEWCPPDSPPPATNVSQALLENLLSERFANRSWVERL